MKVPTVTDVSDRSEHVHGQANGSDLVNPGAVRTMRRIDRAPSGWGAEPASDRSGVQVTGFGYALPERTVGSAEVEAGVACGPGRFRLPPGIVALGSGVHYRQWRALGQNASDLAAQAARQALTDAGVHPDQIDLLIFGAASQDVAEPATANIVQAALGCSRASCFDVKNACCSFLNALDVAHGAVETGRAHRVLVVSGEVLSPLAGAVIGNLGELQRRFAGLTLGDGAGAMVVERAVAGRSGCLHRGSFASDGRHWEASVIRDGGCRRWTDRPVLECDGATLRRLARRYVPQVVAAALHQARWETCDVDLLVPHQVGVAIIDELAALLGFGGDQVVTTVAETGNTAAASIPLALAKAVEAGRCPPGTKILLVAGAGGFSAGAVAMQR